MAAYEDTEPRYQTCTFAENPSHPKDGKAMQARHEQNAKWAQTFAGNDMVSKRFLLAIICALFVTMICGFVGVYVMVSSLDNDLQDICGFTKQEIYNGTCLNNGSFVIDSSQYRCLCTNGFSGQRCEKDLNECSSETHNCHQHATCINTVGGFQCSCNANYTGNGVKCDFDECASGTHNCHRHATCINTVGGSQCSCNANYTGNGTVCGPNFCSANIGLCKHNGTCLDTTTAYNCSCDRWHAGDHCEQELDHVIMTTAMTWANARKYCQSIGGDLATWGMRNATVRNWIKTNLLRTRPSAFYWIGLTDIEQEGTWKYIDGVPMTTANTDFEPGEPNGNWPSGADCGHMHYGFGFKMDDNGCELKQLAICERLLP